MAKARKNSPILTAASVEPLIEKYLGNMAAIARALKVTRQAVSKFLATKPELQEMCSSETERAIDIAEMSLYKQAANGEAWAVCFLLKTKGKHRGYVERQEQTGADGQPLNPPVVVYLPDNGRTQATEEDDPSQAHDD